MEFLNKLCIRLKCFCCCKSIDGNVTAPTYCRCCRRYDFDYDSITTDEEDYIEINESFFSFNPFRKIKNFFKY